jgi:hypothetical protein
VSKPTLPALSGGVASAHLPQNRSHLPLAAEIACHATVTSKSDGSEPATKLHNQEAMVEVRARSGDWHAGFRLRAFHRDGTVSIRSETGKMLRLRKWEWREGAEERAALLAVLESLKVVELRRMARQAGHKGLARSGRKADLLAMLAT